MGGPGGTTGANGTAHPRAQQYLDDLAHHALQADQPIAIDSAALISLIAMSQPAFTLLRPLLRNPDLAIVISTITLTEVVTRPARAGDARRITAIQRGLQEFLRLRIIDFDQRHAIEAAYVRGQTGLKLPDAAIIATARLAYAHAIIGNDRQWRHRPLGVPYHHVDDILALQ